VVIFECLRQFTYRPSCCSRRHRIRRYRGFTHPKKYYALGYEPTYWKEVAKTLERGKFDMLFLADSLGGGASADQIR
jgi:alkanesulfonate monooxygenase SsuD/methylene tetrahydromethanopterin reductase-like flavin-dependent oxidoreductase (luciferase family)